MFYRRKVLMALLQSFEGKLEKIAFQKLLFLISNKQRDAAYSFIPFHYGSYSISANADLTAMVRHGLLTEDINCFRKADKTDYIGKLTFEDRKILAEIKLNYGNLTSKELMKFTYLNFCYYAINSKSAKNILTASEYKKVLSAKPVNTETVLFTIGYEGIHLEEYLNRLIKNDVKTLIDVRNNPVSMKYGFSKNMLKTFCEKLNIEYIHIPEVGIRSEYRKSLKVQSDYNKLFAEYKKDTLKQTKNYQNKILELLKNKRRIALTCFESDVSKCHRSHLAKSITELSDWKFELKHI